MDWRVRHMSREDAEAWTYEPGKTWAWISIRDPDSAPPALSGPVCAQCFHDLNAPWQEGLPGVVPFRTDQADAIAAFALEHRAVDRLLVHCEAGLSRSAAVARAIGDRLGLPWYERKFAPNPLVYDRMAAALERAVVGVAP